MKCKKGVRKDVECAFGVLQVWWEIVKNPVRQWDLDTISNILMACIIMHNMILEDDRGLRMKPIGLQVQRRQHESGVFLS